MLVGVLAGPAPAPHAVHAALSGAGEGAAAGDVALWPRDPWYVDVHHHWAETYIRVLWEEGVADGYVGEVLFGRRSSFRPDQHAGRGQLAILFARGFRVPPSLPPRRAFADVPADHCEYDSKPAAGYIAAACRAGLTRPVAADEFAPSLAAERQGVVAGLIAGLGLDDWKDLLSQADIDAALGKFRDRAGVAAECRAALALAVRLGIVQGYPDRTLRPTRMLSRAEAATLVYRCCMARVTATPDPFSPDGDGVEDATRIALVTPRNRNLSGWQASIEGWLFPAGGATPVPGVACRQFGAPWPPHPPAAVWDGADAAGRPLPPGVYIIRARVWDRLHQAFDAVPRPILLIRRGLEARLDPPVALAGQRVAVLAATTGGADGVAAAAPWGGAAPLSRAGGGRPEGWLDLAGVVSWRGALDLPPDLAPGTHDVAVRASFAGVARDVTLHLQVLQELSLCGRLFPNPARPGQAVTIEAETTPPADAVTAALPGGATAAMEGRGAPDGGATTPAAGWRLSFVIDPGAGAGAYDVTLTAQWGDVTRSLVLGLAVVDGQGWAVRATLTD